MAVDWSRLVVGPTVDIFGTPARFTPCSGPPFDLTGVFDAYSTVDSIVSGEVVAAIQPTFGYQSSDLPTRPAQGDVLEVDGVRYVVRDARIDGHGWGRLFLQVAKR